ncbi:bifunctional DNA primase/polymerase-like protein [Micrococcus sp. KT16]|uniref:AAA family ATPase n=1 Tax=Micrococcus sp. KT16 TaxID=2184005 RepID=UPI000DFABBD4|nr:AAA family ATPase [Micrococcus sp. KT16]RBO87225.1 bifunctional DNA primase/polymerase-like protein [Micrococcus sp. KT16]
MSAALIDTARQMHAAGVNVIPVRHDGTKAPALKAWQSHRTTAADLEAWFGGDDPRYRAIGAACGALSGGLEMLEIEGAHVGLLEDVGRAAGAAGLLELWERVNGGWCELSPSGGVHWFYRVEGMDVPGNTKLAATEARQTIAETRGQGGQVVLAPSGGTTHKTGRAWERLDGGPETVPTLTAAEREALHGLFRALDRAPERVPAPAPTSTPQRAEGPRPGDLWAARTTWADLLTRHGWQVHHTSGVETHWTRPGKSTTEGPSATTREDGGLYVFSTSTMFDAETPYSKFGAYAVLEHGGDHAAAARALAADGFTDRPVVPRTAPAPEAVTEAPGAVERYSRDRAIAEAAERLRVTEAARRMVSAERAAQAPPPVPVDMGEFIAAHADDEASWLLEDLWPLGGRVMLTAPAKGGKTTMMGNLVRTLADGAPFLDRFAPVNLSETGGRVVLLDTEMTEGHLARWLRAVKVRHPERVRVVSLRGRVQTLDPTEPANRAQWARILAGAQTVILDPVGPVLAALGLEENSSTDVGGFFTGWDALMAEAGVQNSLIVHHHGHSGERARGSSKFADSCDALWTLVRDGDATDAPRYFKAMGRDVDVSEGRLEFDAGTRHLSYTEGNRTQDRQTERLDDLVPKVVDYVTAHPGVSGAGIEAAFPARAAEVRAARQHALETGQIVERRREGRGGGKAYHPPLS